MCRMCDGASPEDLLAENATKLVAYGYVLQAVEGGDRNEPWVYTVGLLDAADHPELIVAGAEIPTSARILAATADAILEGTRYDVGDVLHVQDASIRFGAVDEVQYRLDTFNTWHELRDAGVLRAERLTALQVVLGPTFFCHEHQRSQPLLSDPAAGSANGRRDRTGPPAVATCDEVPEHGTHVA